MMFKTHLVVSLLLSLILFPFFSLDEIIFLIVFIIGSIFPDIDAQTSFIGKRAWLFGKFFLQRGIFHSIWMLLLLVSVIWIFEPKLALVFGLGYVSHLMLDTLNHAGIRPFHPISRFRIKGYFKTGGIAEKTIFIISLAACFILLLR